VGGGYFTIFDKENWENFGEFCFPSVN